MNTGTTGTILLLYIKLYCHGPVGTIELVFYREFKCIMSFIQSVTCFLELFMISHIATAPCSIQLVMLSFSQNLAAFHYNKSSHHVQL